ncbi:MAG: hypothetical protein JRL30_22930 [Deltaproteobacteria bacterium]|nr:hypothetical protein [Deltaproteobacteria bacterium]
MDCTNAYYKTLRYRVGDFFGPVDLGCHHRKTAANPSRMKDMDHAKGLNR